MSGRRSAGPGLGPQFLQCWWIANPQSQNSMPDHAFGLTHLTSRCKHRFLLDPVKQAQAHARDMASGAWKLTFNVDGGYMIKSFTKFTL
mmetsp:Transcript_39740/g.62060  ORF Transcript_39740/g.62060 Transcript_39740/m.62060 type:complete len:89 (-) Transcript_39740:590-856(-)